MHRRYHWRLKERELLLGDRTLVLGVLNVTPDSFSDGGDYADPDRAFARAIELEDQGADILDIGAESTRPGSQRISEGGRVAAAYTGPETIARQVDDSNFGGYLQVRRRGQGIGAWRRDHQRSERNPARRPASQDSHEIRCRPDPQPHARELRRPGPSFLL